MGRNGGGDGCYTAHMNVLLVITLCLTATSTSGPSDPGSFLSLGEFRAGGAAPTPTQGLTQGLTQAEWRKSFTQAMTIGSSKEMERLFKKNDHFAAEWIIETAEAISSAPSDLLFKRMDAFRKAWKAALKTDFCNKMEVYFSLLDPATKRARHRLRADYAKKTVLYHDNMNGEKLSHKFTALGMGFEEVGKAFIDLGDHYFASRCFHFAANCYEEPALGKANADLKRACKNFAAYFKASEEIELKDRLYVQTEERYKVLVGLGFGEESEGGESGEGGKGPGKAVAKTAGPAVTMEMKFDLVDKLSAYLRPSYFFDDIYPIWNALSLNKKGSRTTITRIENGPDVLRVGSADIQVDTDRDGEGDVDLPIRGRLAPVVVEIGEGTAKRKWAFLAITGGETDTYQNVQVNLSPNDDLMSIYYAPAGSMVGEVGGTTLRILDDNVDGVYGSPAVAYGHIGLSKGHYQPEMDSMVIGKSKRALPFSEYVQIGKQWYSLEVLDGGKKVQATPQNIPTGKLKLKFKGPKPQFVIVRGEARFENSYFDLSSGKEVEVPTGRYNLYFGMVSKGKKQQVLKSIILPSDTPNTWTISKEGETVEVQLGAPFGFDFKTEVSDTQVTVVGQSVCVTGVAGERYERIWGAVARPEMSYRVKGSKRGSKGEEMDIVQDQDALYKSWKQAWFPLDLTVTKRASETDVEVQLSQKKNKLFGSISSVWR